MDVSPGGETGFDEGAFCKVLLSIAPGLEATSATAPASPPIAASNTYQSAPF